MSNIADHAQRRQEAWVERRRLRLAAAVKQAAQESGFNCPMVLCAFLVRLLELLDRDANRSAH